MLCSESNRFPLPGSPSTCALDTSITPLPSFLLLTFLALYLPICFVLSKRSAPFPSSNTISSNSKPTFNEYSYSTPSESLPRRRIVRGVFPKWVHYIYLGLVVCLLALHVLELARLVAARMGVGLLPVGLVANVVNVVMLTCAEEKLGLGMGRMRSLGVSASLVLYWAASTVLESVKVARLSSYNSLFPAKGTAYPSSDWLLDNGCMLGLFVVFFFIEGTYLVLRWRSSTLPLSPSLTTERGRVRAVEESIGERKGISISNPRPMAEYEYDPVVFLDSRTTTVGAGTRVGTATAV